MPSSIPSTSMGSGRKTKSFCNFSGLSTPQMTQMARYGIKFNFCICTACTGEKKMITINFACVTPRDHSATLYNVMVVQYYSCPHLLLVEDTSMDNVMCVQSQPNRPRPLG